MKIPYFCEQSCRQRQQTLVDELHRLDVELAILTRSESVQWLTGAYVGPLMEVMAAIDAQGDVTLVLPARKLEIPHSATRTAGYDAKWLSTMRDDQRKASTLALLATIPRLPKRMATEFSKHSQYLTADHRCELVDLEPTLFTLRRQKYPDELALLSQANRANQKMYERAREMVVPGVNELDLYSELHRTAVAELGEPLTYFGQDFQCGSRGGPPRDRAAQAGELYILDLGVGFRGYYSDNARTLSVTSPTDPQSAAWHRLASIFPLVEATVRPGVSCAGLFATVKEQLSSAEPWLFNHHLGHGVGLAPHEGPHLNPHWDDTFAEGDFFTVEPGLYHPDLNAGIRLEQNYVVTPTGVELLTPWPLELC